MAAYLGITPLPSDYAIFLSDSVIWSRRGVGQGIAESLRYLVIMQGFLSDSVIWSGLGCTWESLHHSNT